MNRPVISASGMNLNSNNFTNACFISYKHPPSNVTKHRWSDYARVITDMIEYVLELRIRCYCDMKLTAGDQYPKVLSQELCRSVCMVAILIPQYFESSWCKAEWKAMEELEKRRLGAGKKGLIFPIVFRKPSEQEDNLKKVWDDFLEGRKYVDFSHVRRPTRELNNNKSMTEIDKIADQIHQHARRFMTFQLNCNEFNLPIIDKREDNKAALDDIYPGNWK